MSKKLLALLLAVVMLVGLVPMTVMADGETTDVAQIGEVKYETLQAAVNAANTGETIVLLRDFSEGTIDASQKTFTLDLNGKTWTASQRIAMFGSGTNFILIDSVGTGVITNEGTTDESPEPDPSGLLDFGGFSTAVYRGGKLVTKGRQLAAVNGIVYSKATFEGTSVETDSGLCGPDPGYLKLSITITAGTFNVDPTEYVADGYTVDNNGDGTWTVKAEEKTVEVNSTETLQAALDAATDGTTIVVAAGNYDTVYLRNNGETANRIMKDVTVKAADDATVNIVQFKGKTEKGKTLDIENLTIDGLVFSDPNHSGVQLDVNNNALRVNGLTVQNCSKTGDNRTASTAHEGYDHAAFVDLTFSGELDIDAPFAGDDKLICGYHDIKVLNNNIKSVYQPIKFPNSGPLYGLTVSGNTFTDCEHNHMMLSTKTTGNVVITDNTIIGMAGRFARISGAASNAEFTIENNTVQNAKIFEDEFGTDIVKITGASGFKVTDANNTWNDKGFTNDSQTTWIANATPVAQIVEDQKTKNFGSLAAAIAACPTDGTETTITMIADETIEVSGSAITISNQKNVVLDLNGKSVRGDCSTGKGSELIMNYGTLTIKDSTDTNKDGTGTGKMTYGASPVWNYEETVNNSYASNLINNRGTLTIESGYYQNNSDGAGGSACYVVDNYAMSSNASFTLNGGKLVNNTYTAVRFATNSSTNKCTAELKGGIIESKYSCVFNYNNNLAPKADVKFCGTIINGQEYSLYESSAGINDKADYSGIKLSVEAGKFSGTEEIFDVNKVSNFVSGGYFKSQIDAKYIAEGYQCIENPVYDANIVEQTSVAYYPYMIGEVAESTLVHVKTETKEQIKEKIDGTTDDTQKEEAALTVQTLITQTIAKNADTDPKNSTKSTLEKALIETINAPAATGGDNAVIAGLKADARNNHGTDYLDEKLIDAISAQDIKLKKLEIEFEKVEVNAVEAQAATTTFNSITYDVVPVVIAEVGGKEVKTEVHVLAEPVTFRLAVNFAEGNQVIVYNNHDGNEKLLGTYTVQSEDGKNFVELASKEFSDFTIVDVTTESVDANPNYFDFKSASVTIADGLTLNIKVNASQTPSENGNVELNQVVLMAKFADDTEGISLEYTQAGDGFYTFKCNVDPEDILTDITFTLYAKGEGDTVYQLNKKLTYSIEKYCTRQLGQLSLSYSPSVVNKATLESYGILYYKEKPDTVVRPDDYYKAPETIEEAKNNTDGYWGNSQNVELTKDAYTYVFNTVYLPNEQAFALYALLNNILAYGKAASENVVEGWTVSDDYNLGCYEGKGKFIEASSIDPLPDGIDTLTATVGLNSKVDVILTIETDGLEYIGYEARFVEWGNKGGTYNGGVLGYNQGGAKTLTGSGSTTIKLTGFNATELDDQIDFKINFKNGEKITFTTSVYNLLNELKTKTPAQKNLATAVQNYGLAADYYAYIASELASISQ